MTGPTKLLIWQTSTICPYNCEFCSVSAQYVRRENAQIIIEHPSLDPAKKIQIAIDDNKTIYDAAHFALIGQQRELSQNQKLTVLNNIDYVDDAAYFCFSGGDFLVLDHHKTIIKKAAKKFGKHNISVTPTGFGLATLGNNLPKIFDYLDDINFTYDEPASLLLNRPSGYNANNLKYIAFLRDLYPNLKTTAQIILSAKNSDLTILEAIYKELNAFNVDRIYLMPVFPVGRGSKTAYTIESAASLKKQVAFLKNLETQYGKPVILVKSIINNLIARNDNVIRVKDLLMNALNITHRGLLVASSWVCNQNGEPLQSFILGNLLTETMSTILRRAGHYNAILLANMTSNAIDMLSVADMWDNNEVLKILNRQLFYNVEASI